MICVFTHRLRACIGLAPTIARHVHLQGIADGTGTEGETRRCVVGRGAPQRLDIAFGLFEVGEVTGTGHGLYVAVCPGREAVVHLVEVGQLVAGFVDLPVVRVAPQHDDVVSAVLNRRPGAHDRNVQIFRREGVLVLLIGVVGVVGMLRLQDMRRARTEGAVGHLVEVLGGEGFLEGPLQRVGVDRLERGALAERFRGRAVQRRDVGIENIVLPVEHRVVGVEGIAVGPLGTLDQVHGELTPVVGPFPALGEVRHGREVVGADHEQRPGAGEALGHADVDAAPAL